MLDVGALALGVASLFRPGALHHDYPWVDNSLGISWLKPVMDLTDRLVGELYVLFFGLLVLSVATLADRYRLSGRETRQQIKWLAYAGVLAVFNVFWLLAGDYTPAIEPTAYPFAEWRLRFVLFVAIPLAVTIGILRYRLYDIDLLVSRPLVYGLLTAILALGYFGGVALLQELVDTLTDTVRGVAVADGGGGHHISNSRARPAAAQSYPGHHRPPVLPPQVRRGPDGGGICRDPAR